MKQYLKTKDSKLEGFGKIPNDWKEPAIWNLRQMRMIDFQDGNHGALHPKSDDFITEGRSFLTANNIDEFGFIDFENAGKLSEEFCKKLRIGFSKANDVLFTHNATVGRVAVMPSNAPNSIIGTSITYYRFNQKNIDNRYFAYLMKSDYISSQYEPIMKQSTRNQFSIQKQAKLHVLLPNLKEQKQIADFLDNKIKTIWNEISNSHKLIELIKEKQQSTINHVITSGLDDTVLMGDSGVSWIKKIPENWKITRLGNFIKKTILGTNVVAEDDDVHGIFLLKMGNMTFSGFNFSKKEFVDPKKIIGLGMLYLKKNDFLFNTRNSPYLVGKCCVWDNQIDDAIFNNNIMRINFTKEIIPKFLMYFLNSSFGRDLLTLKINQTTNVAAIYYKDLSGLRIIKPPFNEQKTIVSYLDEKNKKINSLISKVELQIKQLQEFRESLISSAVTGKIQVAEA